MARTFGKVYNDLWDPEYGFRDLSSIAQHLYLFITVQPDLNKAGVIPLRERRWSQACPDWNPGIIIAALDELACGGFIVTDPDNEELLICNFIHRDGIYREPNSVRTACKAIREIRSEGIKAALYEDLRAIEADIVAKGTRDSVEDYWDILAYLDGYARPSSRVVRPFSKASVTQVVVMGDPPRGDMSSPCLMSGTTGPNALDGIQETSDSRPAALPSVRPEVVELCEHLADRLVANGCKRPRITQKWLDAARLLLDKDGKTAEQVRRAIDWCQDNEFWRSNIMSMPTLRDQYERLQLQARRTGNGGFVAGTGAGAVVAAVRSADDMKI
jgi:hypothetical protein